MSDEELKIIVTRLQINEARNDQRIKGLEGSVKFVFGLALTTIIGFLVQIFNTVLFP